MSGEIISFDIMDSTPLDSDGNIGINGSGWVAVIRLADMTDDVGALDAGKLTLTVSDPGFNPDGTPSTVTRQIYGVAHLRRQWPNGNDRMIFADGGDLLIHVTLSDWIYDGSTIVSVEIADGFYPGIVAGSPAAINNNSEREYPDPVWAWINPQNERTGLTHEIEGVAFHRHGRNGQQVACIGYIVSDGINTANEIIVSAPELSQRVKQGNIPETWRGVLDMSDIDQGIMATVNVRIYPWIGLAYDMSVSGVAWPTAAPMTTLRVFCDKTGAYGGGYAYVQVGATGGAASGDPVVAKTTPFPTYGAAAIGLQEWNNTNKGHNTLGGGTIRFMDDGAGGPQNHSIAGNIRDAPGETWCVIEKDPDTEAEVSFTVTTNSRSPNLCHWRNLTHLIGLVGYNWSGLNEPASMICVENCLVDNTENRSVIARYDYKYLIGVTVVGGRFNINDLPTATAIPASLIGCVGENPSTYCRTMIGNIMPGYEINTGGTAREFMIEGGHVIYNNRVKSAFFRNTGTPAVMDHGVANVQNLYEKIVDAGVICMNFFADSDLTEIHNYLDLHNTSVGDRASRMYNDEAQTQIAPAGMQKIATSKYSLYDNFNVKVDNFRDAGGGSVGAFAYSYSVGNDGNVNLFGAAQRQTTQVPSNSATDARLGNAWLPTAEPNLTRPEINMSWGDIMDMFADYTVAPREVSVGGGDYRPLVDAAPLLNRVAAGHSILAYDQGGAPRKADGTGAAGAFEAMQDPAFDFSYTGDGGLIFGGSATVSQSFAFTYTGNGGLSFGGQASYSSSQAVNDFSYRGDGGLTFGGQADYSSSEENLDITAYGTDSGFTNWLAMQGLTLPAGSLSVPILRQIGSDYVDAAYSWRLQCSQRTGGFAQLREWPRTGHVINRQKVPSDLIPQAWVQASYRAAYLNAAYPGWSNNTINATRQTKREKVGPIEREFFSGDDAAGSAVAPGMISDSVINALLLPWLCPEKPTRNPCNLFRVI